MSAEDEAEERRLYQCLMKYQKIVKQFDELVEIMDVSSRQPKRSMGSRGSSSSNHRASENEADDGEVLVQTITRLLHELKSNPTPDPNSSTTNPGPA